MLTFSFLSLIAHDIEYENFAPTLAYTFWGPLQILRIHFPCIQFHPRFCHVVIIDKYSHDGIYVGSYGGALSKFDYNNCALLFDWWILNK